MSVTIIDGGSGSGKTTVARSLVDAANRAGRLTRLVSLDDFYPGWYGLEAASRMVVDDVLDRRCYRRWDWVQHAPADLVEIGDGDLVVEGCGALTPDSAARATRRIWLQMPAGLRRRRALSRPDGAGFRPWWDVWAAQEHRHWLAHRPWLLADEIILPGRAANG